MTNAPWFLRNDVIHKDLKIEMIEDHVKNIPRKFFTRLQDYKNPLINCQVEYAHKNGKYPYPYSTNKWSLPLIPPYLEIFPRNTPSNKSINFHCFSYYLLSLISTTPHKLQRLS
ncbi:hypothetical protein AVEN_74482-1 [Araneus ventricosus]|uniref:Uncharacterized protein n=1 Tax=Araneus ventricosus TaxID=182803 RepID=A0A4Y2VC40_ARAVE|nr:hypothetical protein AVEN_74482-1 [Araneus ventricosus]